MSLCKILDGKALASRIHKKLHTEVDNYVQQGKRQPGLAVVLVGENPASKTYVANKEKTATQKCGFKSFNAILAEDATQEEVAAAISKFNNNPEVDGILMQLPLPKHLDSTSLLNLISPEKDVDGLHPVNQGLLMRGLAGIRPCTPLGIMKLLDLAYQDDGCEEDAPAADLSGLKAVVIGRSILVGKPVSMLLLERNATVTVVHSRTKEGAKICREADIIVAAVGVSQMVTKEWVSKGSIVIDVGINRLSDGKLVGDVDFEGVKELCRAITPVPGGVGPMTVAMLMANTFDAYKRSLLSPSSC